ncbi:tetratricopeptide repeat-containing sensor histidine kinase [Mucilaginibacter sp. FT3.2]|uniref:tetratricopeptide repeat-containing sensor histidine kinase n=1 Tax=Mucilaginibacter sp. FT3.2 TaxID=2723090 RepID=UPI0016181283|nr:tetratricopeptide repeat protein [Mucilaginibacter sp. FT3.2]MBB6231926.1 signal transduction histidine kinase [Mucilaginibacter sp. FT3.2]
MKYLFSLLLLFAIIPCSGQNIDSLKKVVSGKASAQKRLSATLQITGYVSAKNPDDAIAIAKTGLELAAKLNDKKATGLLLRDIGKANYQKGDYDAATDYYSKAVTVLSTISRQDTLAGNYAQLAQHYGKVKNYDKAIELYNTVIDIAPKTGSRLILMTALSATGLLYEYKHSYREALNYYRQSFDISDSLDFVNKSKQSTSEAYSHNFMVDVIGSIRQKNESVQDILKNIDTKRSLNDTLALTINYFNLGLLYKSKRQYPQALDALQSCLQYAAKINYTDMQGSALNEIADLYGQTGDYRQSLVYLKKRADLNAPGNAKKSSTIDELQTKYEITQREDQLLQQQFEITKRNYWMTGIVVFVLLMLVIVFIYYKQTRLKQRNLAMQAIIETEESERRRIAQDLHDSVSQTMSAAKINLTVIGGELPFINDEQRKRFEKAINLVDYGFREVRTISHNMMPWALHKTGLAQVIKQFIENIGSDAIAINFFSKGFDAPFNDTIEIILYRVLQESVNNVMKHANASRVDISLMRDEANISLTIEDNGKGFDTSHPEMYSGMGLNNLRSRINFLKGKVELDSEVGKGTLVSVYIPVGNKGV